MYNELLQVPLIMAGNKLKHMVVDTPIRLIDPFPSVLNILNLKSNYYNLKGVSFLSVLMERNGELEILIFSMGTLYGDEKYCLINDNKKIIIHIGNKNKKLKMIGPRNRRKLEFYDLTGDPREKKNLANVESETVGQFKKLLAQFIKDKSILKRKKKPRIKRQKSQWNPWAIFNCILACPFFPYNNLIECYIFIIFCKLLRKK